MATNSCVNTGNPITVGQGGTSATTFTSNGVLIGNSTSAINVLSVGASSTILQGVTSSEPTFTATPTVTSISFDGSNYLNAYKNSGFWNAALTFGGGNTGITYASNNSYYVHIGNVVYVFIQCSLTSKGSSTGTMNITGLSFTPTSGMVLNDIKSNEFTYVGQIYVYIDTSANITCQLASTTNLPVVLDNTYFADNTSIQCTGFFFV